MDKKDRELKPSGKTAKRTVPNGQPTGRHQGKGRLLWDKGGSRWTTGTSARAKDLGGGGRLGGAETPWTGPELAAKHTVRREECVEYLPTVFYAQGTIHTLSHLTPIASLYTVLLQFYRLRK